MLKQQSEETMRSVVKNIAPPPSVPGLVGTSQAMAKLQDTIDRLARFRANVLILGESGTGKELIARALHARGPRRNAVFVPVNCATLARELLENELFGHERGAFAGATERKRGLFEVADGGTLFLDEIAEMDVAMQAKLLRVLERSEFRRVGGTRKLRVDLTVVATTNRDLPAEMAAGRFRADLFYRLKVATLVVPPLRDRREDIPALVDAFIADFNRRNDGKIRGLAPAALKRLVEHAWPGNVRELKNVIEAAAMLTDGDTLGGARFEEALATATLRPRPDSAGDDRRDELRVKIGTRLDDVERAVITATVARARTRTEAAAQLGIGERTLYTKLRQYGVA
jgi:DNA-binding NtrC family response regulator